MDYKIKEGYKLYTVCRFCKKSLKQRVINLGRMPLAGGFLKTKKDFEKEKLYPLTLAFCENCYLLQTREVISQEILFRNYFYRSSAIQTLIDFFEQNVSDVKKKFPNSSKTFIVEIGSNDGAFIKSLISKGFNAIGVDPAENIVKPLIKEGIPLVHAYFSEKVAKEIKEKYGRADAIYSFNTLAHIEDMHDVIKGVKIVLKDNGILVFQVHYLGRLIKDLQYDMIYHEHQYYYSLLTLKKFFSKYKMTIYDVKLIDLHGGSIIFYLKNSSSLINPITKNVKDLENLEKEQNLDKAETFRLFSKTITIHRKKLTNLLIKLKNQKKKIVGYGASGRATIITNYCGIDGKYLEYMIDDSKIKQENYMPGIHLPIYSPSILHHNKKISYILVFAWAFLKELVNRNRKYLDKNIKFITPLPKIKIFDLKHAE